VPAAEVADQLAHLDDLGRVEAVGGLVQDQEAGLVEQRLGDRDPLAIAARQLADLEPPDGPEPEALDHALDRGAGGAPAQPLDARHERQELGDPHVVVERHVLGHVADPGA
jgi:hypothetical protein